MRINLVIWLLMKLLSRRWICWGWYKRSYCDTIPKVVGEFEFKIDEFDEGRDEIVEDVYVFVVWMKLLN